MDILNLHGYKGNSENTMYHVLQELFPEAIIHSPAIDYDSLPPWHAFDYISQYLIKDLDLIVGTSLGGIFAMTLCVQYELKCQCIVLNPALHPCELLPKLGYNKRKLAEFQALELSNSEKIKNYENLLVLTGKDDDIVGDLSEEPLLQSRIKQINCGHSANGNAEAIAKIKREITSWLT
jgi:predicted esterase YcpF (UPF0227 family)